MKFKVIRAFRDKKNNKKPYNKGSEFETKDTKRAKELMDKGFLEQQDLPKDESKEDKKPAKKKSKKKDD